MDIGLQKGGEHIVHQTMPLYQRFAGKHVRHDVKVKVPFAAPACVTSVGRAVVTNLDSNGMQTILHHSADSFNPGRCS